MLTHCPHCQQSLQLTKDMISRLEQALSQLDPGKMLTIKCPLCRKAITLEKSGRPQMSPAKVQPPPPPNLDWLTTGLFEGEDKVEDVPMVLILHKPDEQRQRISEALEAVGYQVFMADTVQDALERMRFVQYSCIVLQAEMEGTLAQSTFHTHMRTLSMDRRRYIFYILIGDTLHTLYNLEALAFSANLIVNTADIPHLDVILRKSIPTYEELFGPFLEELSSYGKR
jgi:CheY-like chemotaxis protein